MIESITLKNVATYSEEKLSELKTFNYIFGNNGSGKTTISRVIANITQYPNCSITSNEELETLVYNHDFIDVYFKENQNLPGVFTLGKDNIEIREEIKQKTIELEKIKEKIIFSSEQLNNHKDDNPAGKEIELEKLEKDYQTVFWKDAQYKNTFSECLSGYKGSKKDFFYKVLNEYENNNEELLTIEDLLQDIKKIYNKNLSHVDKISTYPFTEIDLLEKDSILNVPIIGSKDVDIADMIKKLDNSDWVKKGKDYLENNDNKCPFCQRDLDNNFRAQLNAYFDETYISNLKKIATLKENYTKVVDDFNKYISLLKEDQKSFINDEEFQQNKNNLQRIFTKNVQTLNDKMKEPSRRFTLDSSFDSYKSFFDTIVRANNAIDENNKIFDNISMAKIDISNKVWKFIITDLDEAIKLYLSQRASLSEEINKLRQEEKELSTEKNILENEISKLNKSVTSIKPVCESINNTLKTFGFSNFHLSATDDNFYKIMRDETTEVRGTLSEGEKNFLTFLYFYNLILGTIEQDKTLKNKIVVIDDPVSSLDNNVLFVVTSLVRDLIINIRNKTIPVNQLFVLTHNIAFFKEITQKFYELNKTAKEEKYFIVSKNNQQSNIKSYPENPIKSSYELLWDELKNKNSSTMQNTMRRILETYFKFFGGIPIHKLKQGFKDENELKAVSSLVAWIESGSHEILEDSYYTPLNQEQKEFYLKIFEKIFVTLDHKGHYNMMMKKDTEFEGE